MNNSSIDWTKDQRQAPIGLIVFSIETIRHLVRFLWPLLIGIFVSKGNHGEANPVKEQLYLYGTIAFVVFVLINSFLSYWFFRFRIENNELFIKKGYLKKIHLSIPLERIQTVNIKQNLIQRILNLVSVEIDTAGANDTEVKLIAVKRELAESLREIIKQDSTSSETESPNIEEENSESKTILALSLSDVIKVGISENHLRSFAAILGIGYWFYSQIKDFYNIDVDELILDSTQSIEHFNISAFFWFFIVIFMFLISVLLSFILSFIRFYELKLSKQEHSFKLSFGLIQTKEITIPKDKIQIISWHQNPLRQLLRFETLKIKQATSGDQIKKKQAIEIPACRLSHQEKIKNAIFEEVAPDFSEAVKSHWIYFLRNFVFVSLIFILPTVFHWWQDTEYQITLAIYELFAMVFFYLSYRKRTFRISNSQLEITKGHISKTIYQLQNYKIQSVKFTQNILTKRRELADITIYTAAGENLKIPYIQEKTAIDLYNFLLYKIESTEKAWM